MSYLCWWIKLVIQNEGLEISSPWNEPDNMELFTYASVNVINLFYLPLK